MDIEKNGETKNVQDAINEIREAFKGEAERLKLKDEEDVAEMIKEVRKKKW